MWHQQWCHLSGLAAPLASLAAARPAQRSAPSLMHALLVAQICSLLDRSPLQDWVPPYAASTCMHDQTSSASATTGKLVWPVDGHFHIGK